MNGRMNRHTGFTLMELLVVIAIIGVLVSVLLPVLGNARDTASSSVCLSNLRQMGMAVHGYCDEENGYFPLFAVNETVSGVSYTRYWFGRSDQVFPETDRTLDRSMGLIGRYLGGNGHGVVDGLLCPKFPYDAGNFARKFSSRACSYGININLSPYAFVAGSNGNVPVHRDRILRPTKVMAFADGVQYWSAEDTFNEGFYIGIDDASYAMADPLDDVNGGFAHFRHGGGGGGGVGGGATQLVYVDGHAEVARFEDVRRTHAELGGYPAGHLTTGANGADTIYGRIW